MNCSSPVCGWRRANPNETDLPPHGDPRRRCSRLLAFDGADEEGTHERLRGLRDLIEPKIAEQRGRIVKNTGDGFLAEFASVVDAVRCAVEMQRGMAERNSGSMLGPSAD